MKLNELLGTEFPIIQGGMANIATAEFAAACSNAGALGVIAAGGLRTGEALREEIRRCKALTDKPAKRWESLVDKLLLVAAGAFLGWLAAGMPGL